MKFKPQYQQIVRAAAQGKPFDVKTAMETVLMDKARRMVSEAQPHILKHYLEKKK